MARDALPLGVHGCRFRAGARVRAALAGGRSVWQSVGRPTMAHLAARMHVDACDASGKDASRFPMSQHVWRSVLVSRCVPIWCVFVGPRPIEQRPKQWTCSSPALGGLSLEHVCTTSRQRPRWHHVRLTCLQPEGLRQLMGPQLRIGASIGPLSDPLPPMRVVYMLELAAPGQPHTWRSSRGVGPNGAESEGGSPKVPLFSAS